MKSIKISAAEIFKILLENCTKEEILEMTDEEMNDAVREIEDELIESKKPFFPDDFRDDYCMSDSHDEDVRSESWEWLKNV